MSCISSLCLLAPWHLRISRVSGVVAALYMFVGTSTRSLVRCTSDAGHRDVVNCVYIKMFITMRAHSLFLVSDLDVRAPEKSQSIYSSLIGSAGHVEQ